MLEKLIYLLQSIKHAAYYWETGMRRVKENLPPHIKANSLQKCFLLLKTFFFFFSFTKAKNALCIPVRTLLWPPYNKCWASMVALVVKNLPANARSVRDAGLIPGSWRSPGGGHGNPLQDSCLENPMVCSPPGSSVHGIAQSRTRLKSHTHNQCKWEIVHRYFRSSIL